MYQFYQDYLNDPIKEREDTEEDSEDDVIAEKSSQFAYP